MLKVSFVAVDPEADMRLPVPLDFPGNLCNDNP